MHTLRQTIQSNTVYNKNTPVTQTQQPAILSHHKQFTTINAFTNAKPDPTNPIRDNFTWCGIWMQLNVNGNSQLTIIDNFCRRLAFQPRSQTIIKSIQFVINIK